MSLPGDICICQPYFALREISGLLIQACYDGTLVRRVEVGVQIYGSKPRVPHAGDEKFIQALRHEARAVSSSVSKRRHLYLMYGVGGCRALIG